jgi:ubiquinone/menaquinone biosynthesis C-methylase UbiE
LLSPIKHTVGQILYWAVVLAAVIYTLNQVRKPTRWVGRLFLWIMNISHSGVTDWGLKKVQVERTFTILDVGCGGGRTIQKLASLAPEGTVCGVDYAKGSIAASRAKNRELIEAGRVQIIPGSVSRLPFPANMFDLVTAVETQYYWPDLINDMREILRVLKPGGRLVVIAENYKKGTYNMLQRPVMKFLKSSNLGVVEQRELFSSTGYVDIEIFEETTKGWICATGKKLS